MSTASMSMLVEKPAKSIFKMDKMEYQPVHIKYVVKHLSWDGKHIALPIFFFIFKLFILYFIYSLIIQVAS